MLATSRNFEANARAGLANDNLQRALGLARTGFPLRRRVAIDRLPEFEALREIGRSIKDHTLEHLDFYLELYESKVEALGRCPASSMPIRLGVNTAPIGPG